MVSLCSSSSQSVVPFFPGSLRATFLFQSASGPQRHTFKCACCRRQTTPVRSGLHVAVSFCSVSWWAVGSADCCPVSSGCTVSFSVVPKEVLIHILTVLETETYV